MNNKSIPKWFSMLLLMLVAGVTGAWSESLTILDFSIAAGGEKEVAISLEANNASVYGIQTDITLSEGLTLVEAKSAVDGIDAFTNVVSSGATRIVQLSMNKAGAQIPVGNVINLKVKAADNFESGTIELSNTRLTIGTNGQELKMEGTSIAEVTLEQAEEWVWRDIHIDLTNANLLEESEQVQWGTINPFGIAVDKDGVVSRVAADADDSRATVQGKWHSNSCWASLNVSVKVEGPVKVTCGTQPWSDSPVTIKVGNETVASFSNKGNLWTSTATENVVFGYYKGSEPATLTIDGGGYPTYIAIEAVDPADIPNDATVTFDAANAGAEGLAPAAQKVEIGSTVKIPANTTLFIEGKTLTAWTDGTNQYKIGDEVTVNEDMTLTPVFTTNTVSFADRTAETTITWLFGESNGVGTLNAQGKSTILVAQVTIGDETIDMKMNIDATNGKINNVGRGDKWAQCNDGTILTIPAYKGTAVSFDSHSDGTGTTIGGVEATNKEAIYDGTAETLDIVAKGMGYIASVKAVYPAPEEPVAESNYYVVGSMSEWGPKEEYRMTRNQKAEGEEYMITMALTTSTMFKVAKSEDGMSISDNDWYPTGMGNSYGEKGEITADGEYTIYFRPNADGGDDWFYNVIYVAANQPGEDEWKFRDFNTELNTLTQNDESGATVTFGLSVAEDGTVSRVEADAENTAAVVTGKTGNNHGLQNFSATVPVEGAVKITMGTCSWGGEVTVKNAEGETVATFTTKKGEGGAGCYKGNKFDDENIISAKYVGDATTLTITGGAYVNFFAVEAVEASSVEVAYSLGEVECEGDILPTGGTYAAGDEYTIPAKNFTLYKEGYTLTAWSDGTNEYATGSTITLESDITLTPVFTENEVSLADREEAVELNFSFRRDQGAPIVQWQNTNGHRWVTQATVKGKTIDVAMTIDTNPGKFNNSGNADCTQTNNGTIFTVPSCKGAEITMECHGSFSISTTTIDGQTDYEGKGTTTIKQTIASQSETVQIVIGDGSYYRYVKINLPVVQSQGGETFDNVAASATWPMDEPTNYAKCNVDPASAFSTTAVDLGVVRLMDQNGKENATGTSNVSSGVTFSQMRPTNDGNDYVTWSLKPAAGLTFTPKKISAYIVRFGTDAENGVTISAKAGEGEAVTLGNYTAPRNNKSQADDKFGQSANYAVNGLVEIELTEEQQAALETGETLYIMGTIGVGNGKAGGIAQVTVSGVVNGTKADVDIFTLDAVASPEEAGTVSKYPNADEYEAGTEVTLTATENFGYDFVNWTNAAGDEVSTDAKFKYTVNSNETLTANFVAVETYELNLTVDGSNDYMVTVSPAPEVVDGKWMYEAGTGVQLTANQYDGLVTFTNWSDGETNSSKLISMTEDVTLTAFYSQADIIAGWDFYKAGGNGRKADFYAQDNDADALNLVETATGATSGWLDKSTEAAQGYESFKGAAVNWRDNVGTHHWQTKVNAADFESINVQFQMLYNYNAYQTYNVEYSLDGEEWTKVGSITMTGAKQAASFSETLPEACNNQAELYIRMIADKSSSIDGTAGKDGNALAMFFITGSPKIVDDGTAPVLVSTVPENGATGASANGKIVLTFDERVKVADGAKATLGSLELTPAVSGKVVTFDYKGLEYGIEYTFNLPANTVGDLTDNMIAEPITLTFTTMERPTVEKKLYDAVVENVDQLVAALAEAQSRSDKNVRYRIFIKKGEYTLPQGSSRHYHHTNSNTGAVLYDGDKLDPITYFNAQNVSMIGENRDETIITNTIPAEDVFAGQYGTASVYEGIGKSDVFQLSGNDSYWQDLTVSTGMGDALGRDIAIEDMGTRTIWKNTKLHGYQDTWVGQNNNGLFYFEDGIIRGRTDYICGKGDAFYNRVEFQQVAGGYAAVPSVPAKIGWVMKDCTINGDGDGVDGNYTLGRPWGSGTPVALWIDTKMNVVPSAVGWNEMSGGWPKRFAEYNSMTSTGSVIDLSGRKTTFGDGHENNPVLTAEEALEFGNLHNMFGDWDPTLATEQAPIVTDVKLTDNELSWTGSNYALLYAIVKNGSVIDFTTDTKYDISNAPAGSQRAEGTDEYQIRAANEMGGLNEASAVATETDGIETVNVNDNVNVNDHIYNLQGVRVNKAQKGVYIIGGRKVVVK